MSQRSSSRVTRSQSAQGEPLVPPVDNPDRPSVARSDNATSLSALREQVLQMTTEATDAIHARVSIPGSYADPDETIQAEPTIIVGEGNPNESTATAADIIGGRSIPRTTVESVSDPDESRLSEDIGRTPDTTEPVATQVETAQTTGPEHFWNARASISPRGIISVRRRVPVDPTAGIEDQIDPVPPYAPNPLELPTGRYGPTNIPREERHLYSAHPLTGVRTRSQASNAIEAPIPQRPIQVTEQIEAPPQIRIEERPANPTPPRPHSSSPAPEEVPPEGDEYERLLNGPIEDIRRAAARDPTLGFFFRVLDDIKDQLLEGITAQIQVQENRQDTGVQTLNTTLQQMTNSISKLEASTGNIRQQVESAAQNAWTAANSSQLGVNEQIKTQNAIDKLSQQMDTIVVAMGAMGKQVSAALNKQEEAIKKLKADTETLQETLQVVEERISNTDIMDQHHQWEPEAESSRAQVPKRPQGLFPGDNPPGPPSGPPSRGNTPPLRPPKPPKKEGSTKDEIPKGARAKKPEAFNGKRGPEAEIFLMKMEIYFNDYGTAFDNNRKMATFLTNMGEGEAAKWAKPLLRKILDEEPHEYLANWNALKNAFLLAFSDPMKKERAIQNIHKLQQTGSAQHYVTAFRTLMQELDWDEHAFIDVFKKGLKNNVQQELLKATITQDTSTFSLEKWMEVSIRIDDLLFTGRSLRDNGSSGNQERKFQPRTTQAKAGIVPSEVIQKRREEGRCIKCGRRGHRMRECKFKEWQQETQAVKGKEAKIEEVKEEEKSSDSESEN
ncbi:Retrotransposon gag protein [Ceratobasidium sp. AG-Ba]|nr:Retrotransposon gag protein [Ceratobasidium sp. AG-Ba]QRV77052.1 Retrotransposon gag protein [Ceratobasidium sp. AG-Ba]QRV81504.1 Retrotransposon gag protein [Ceratobasidium sp. AG-Ba]QRV83561.1 Retrotransposon gag protein [Ceratobasidium sp. AG-Ba]QRV83569.1 Retrotransposon gag protein [Ceratobasidium sp. AG-Ba]